jgi:hypothetical protein
MFSLRRTPFSSMTGSTDQQRLHDFPRAGQHTVRDGLDLRGRRNRFIRRQTTFRINKVRGKDGVNQC